MFPDAEDSIWAWDEKAGQWYLHHFYSHQPELNISNPAVRDEIAKIAGFWLELGVDGFRVDAVPFLLEGGAIPGDVDLDPHDFLEDFRSFIGRRKGDVVLLGEVNLPAEAAPRLLRRSRRRAPAAVQLPGDGDDVPVARPPGRRARSRRRSRRPNQLEDCQYANFVRNHDELILDQLSEKERQEVFDAFGPDPGYAAVRPGPAPAPAHDAGRRPAAHPHGLQPAVQPARHAGPVLRRGDRHGREPRDRWTHERALADAVDGRAERAGSRDAAPLTA